MATQVITPEWPLILGSASPRRREILQGLGIPIHVAPPSVDELQLPGDTPDAFLDRIVRDKLRAACAGPADGTSGLRRAGVLVADTIVLIDDEILGKPNDVADARRLLGKLAGRTHEVRTRYALAIGVAAQPAVERTVCSKVTMRSATEAELSGYAQTGEGLDKAGAYAVQGLGTFLVQRIEGSYTNVVGLPACELIQDLLRLGLLAQFPVPPA